jgi:hypothetical protein
VGPPFDDHMPKDEASAVDHLIVRFPCSSREMAGLVPPEEEREAITFVTGNAKKLEVGGHDDDDDDDDDDQDAYDRGKS